eukprot:TRINITY_DN3170_c1_g1_i4.p1 TRINITY_DN3170_c1_g1~~TRINITY_DN3170_c1_g1_i4.p1  ORF type:complete len:912 (+),score=237.15 TRINITY_DN3170_c1_g1_i4:65-2800(+)
MASVASNPPRIVICTDLDGTLLDEHTYSAGEAKPCVERCLQAGVPVVACSSKTVAEQLPIHKELGIEGEPFVVENGSAIVAPVGYFTTTHIGEALCKCGYKVQIAKVEKPELRMPYEAIVLGMTSEEIRKVLSEITSSFPGLNGLKTFSDLSVAELAELTGLSTDAAVRAKSRDYSQTISTPLDEKMKEELHHELRKHGMCFASGGRFHTVTALGMDKGNAVTLLRSLLEVKLEEICIVGLGDAENDRTMLQAVDKPILVKRPDGEHCEAADPLRNCLRTNGIGPAGWVEAVESVLDKGAGGLVQTNSKGNLMPHKSKSGLRSIDECWPCDSGVFDANDFLKDLDRLRQKKKEMGVTISFIFPTLEEEETIGYILETVNRVKDGLLDEVVVIDARSKDRTVEIAKEKGAKVVIAPDVLPDWTFRGKGIQLWKSLLETTGDICCWCDSDITNFTEIFVVGLIGPLLADPDCRYVKAFYKRPLRTGEGAATGAIGGRVTELLARPFINLYYPELHDIIQPLSGEFGGWRKDLEKLSFMVGYGVETKLLLEFSRIYGADSIRQVNLHERCHRHQSLPALSKMSFLILQTFFTDMAERFHTPPLVQSMQSSTRIIRAATATNDNVNKVRSGDKELAAEEAAEGIIAASLQDVTAKEIPLPPMVTQAAYLEKSYPGLKPQTVILFAIHDSNRTSVKAVQECVRDLGIAMNRRNVPVGRVVADTAGCRGLPLRAAADFLNCLPDGHGQAHLDVVNLSVVLDDPRSPTSTRAGDFDSVMDFQSDIGKEDEQKALDSMKDALASLAFNKAAGDFDKHEKTSVIIADADCIRLLYKMVYNVRVAKAFMEAEQGQQLCTAWRFDYLASTPRPLLGGRVSSSGSVRSVGTSSTISLAVSSKRMKAHGPCNIVGSQMRRLQLW